VSRPLVSALLLTAVASASATEPRPFVGTVHNTRDHGWLSYECEPGEGDRLTCEMTQVMIRKKLSPAEADSKYQESIRGWPDSLAKEYDTKPDRIMSTKQMADLCAMARAYVATSRGTSNGDGLPPETLAVIRTQTQVQKRDNEEQFGAVIDSCESKNLEGLKRSIRLGIEQEARTCLIFTNRFTQTFRPISNTKDGLPSWTYADPTPQGDCGVVQMPRFRPDVARGSTSTIFWQYVAKRATSNPEGTLLGGMACKDLDESETLYDWRSKPIALQCDYIEHSP
jgi:hypothetical protein